MIIKKEDMKTLSRPRLRDGFGTTDFLHIVPEGFRPEKCRLFSVMVLEKGCSAGRHDHTGETEIYYVIEGEGIINDNGTIRPFRTGDCNVCGDGDFHSVSNENDETLKMIAVIVND
ncbi:MAG: cupin domain-containing protein [Clostridia bacterium]|jgi:mannose-6-phosphate isomerase-like protein (cupin superfamily)|nr:cupin domain-containing protein [Clostridia bacterium]MBT7121817.1 cupin domain-containing protein [Clostridia bacterium]